MEIVEALPEGAVSSSHRAVIRVDVLVEGVVEATIADVEGEGNAVLSGDVILDASAAARGRVNLTVAATDDLIPKDAASLLNVYGNELAVYRGAVVDGRALLVPLGIFGIDRVAVNDPSGTITVSGLDRAGRFIAPESAFEQGDEIASGTKAGDAIIQALTAAWPGLPYDSDAFANATPELPTLSIEEGDDRWGLASGIATACGLELFFNRFGELTIRPVPTPIDSNVARTITDGEGGTLLEIGRDWDRSRVYNKWTVTGQNPSNDPDAPIPYGVAVDDNPNSPTYYFGQNSQGRTFGRRPNRYDNSFIATDTQARDAAQGLLNRSLGAPDSLEFSAICDPALTPSDIVHVERTRLGVAGAVALDTVTIPLEPEAAMSATTRVTQVIE